jgi:hypothetical protein
MTVRHEVAISTVILEFQEITLRSAVSTLLRKEQKEYDNFRRQEEIRLMVVKTLVTRGADLDLKDQRGRTALELARMNHQTLISEFLR